MLNINYEELSLLIKLLEQTDTEIAKKLLTKLKKEMN